MPFLLPINFLGIDGNLFIKKFLRKICAISRGFSIFQKKIQNDRFVFNTIFSPYLRYSSKLLKIY